MSLMRDYAKQNDKIPLHLLENYTMTNFVFHIADHNQNFQVDQIMVWTPVTHDTFVLVVIIYQIFN